MWQVFDSQDGTSSVLSEQFGVSYHSKYGALQESRHVFIESGLYFRAIAKKELSILEMGFGTGLNALLTCLEAGKLSCRISYTGIDLHPLPMEIISRLNYPQILGLSVEDNTFMRIHQIPWGQTINLSEDFSLLKLQMDIQDLNFQEAFDLIYFDAFAPNVQPELWELPLLSQIFKAMLPGGIFVTYCAKGNFKRALRAAGFYVESLPGPPGKREMTRAVKI